MRCNPCLQNFCIENREKTRYFAYGDSRSIVTKRCKIYNHFKPALELSQHLQRCGMMYRSLRVLSNVYVVSSCYKVDVGTDKNLIGYKIFAKKLTKQYYRSSLFFIPVSNIYYQEKNHRAL